MHRWVLGITWYYSQCIIQKQDVNWRFGRPGKGYETEQNRTEGRQWISPLHFSRTASAVLTQLKKRQKVKKKRSWTRKEPEAEDQTEYCSVQLQSPQWPPFKVSTGPVSSVVFPPGEGWREGGRECAREGDTQDDNGPYTGRADPVSGELVLSRHPDT